MHPFLQALQTRPILFDGAIGTELYKRGVFLTNSFEELNLSRPSLVLDVHRAYRKAGAEVLTTNSYGANRIRLDRFGLGDKASTISEASARLALEAAGSAAWVAGSVGPTGLEPGALMGASADRLESAYREQIEALIEGGVDLLLMETFEHLVEMRTALQVAKEVAPDVPRLATMRFTSDETLRDGSEPEDVADALKRWSADVIGCNCGDGPDLVFRVAQRMLGNGLPVMAQPNAGTPEMLEGRTIYVGNPEYFGVFGRRMLKAGISLVGGCCGTAPAHIHRMRGATRMMGGALHVKRAEMETPREAKASSRQKRPAVADRSELARKMEAGKFVVSVEVNPPFGLDPKPAIDAARMLRDAGVDVINIADGPRASVRMSNLAEAVLVQRDLDMEVILHVCCRDRNLLGLQADVLGAHALGIRNLVIITGDPPKLGDYPDATAVYDVDSVGLLRMVDGYNHAVDPVGKEMPEPTHFWVATGAEPAALDYDREIRRLEQKAQAGADFVMTQPVYDPRMFEKFLDDIKHIQLPVLMGLLPLANYRNANFLHENVPGMQIPEEIRSRMKGAGNGEKARAEGVTIAQEALSAVRSRIQGAYIMPPLGHYEMVPRILDVLGDDWKRWPVSDAARQS